MLYIIGSLTNPRVEEVADQLRESGFAVFDQWRAAEGDFWASYAKRRNMNFRDALAMDFTETAFQFDLRYLNAASAGVLVMPAGRSGGMEIGFLLGQGKGGYILYDGEPDRADLMAKLATGIFFSVDEMIEEFKVNPPDKRHLLREVCIVCGQPACDNLHPSARMPARNQNIFGDSVVEGLKRDTQATVFRKERDQAARLSLTPYESCGRCGSAICFGTCRDLGGDGR